MSFLKGFLSLFDWMFPPKSYQELSDDLDNRMQDIYDRNGWGKYNNPLTRTVSSDELNEYLFSYKPGTFIPYAVYSKKDNSLTAHFKDGEYVSIFLNDTVTVFKSFYGGEIIGCRINNINQLKELV
jgi:hypothetical protein